MKWLSQALRFSSSWVVKNPLILFLVIILIIYNQALGGGSALTSENIDWMHAISIWNLLWKTIHLVLRPKWFLLGVLSVVATTLITIFEVEANFAIFASKSKPLIQGIKAAFTWRAFQYFVLQIFIEIIFIFAFLGLVYLIVFPLKLTGLIGSILIFLLVLLGYPTFYMFLALGSVICNARVTLSEKFTLARIALQKDNFSKLFIFYFLRVGAETAILSIAVVIATYIHFKSIFEVLLVALIAVAPFAIIRTGGYMLKFEIFKNDTWFKEYFKELYATNNVDINSR